MPPNPLCRNCDEPMEPGFQLDHVAHAAFLQAQWVRGEPIERRWYSHVEASRAQVRASIKVTSFRCPKCGLLDSYAIDPAQQPV